MEQSVGTLSGPHSGFGKRLRALRRAGGHKTARAFAEVLGISENRYSRYERGEAMPKPALARTICAELKITADELFGWEDRDDAALGSEPGAAPPGPGFSESPAAATLPQVDTARDRAVRSTSQSVLDATRWRLAAALARAGRAQAGMGRTPVEDPSEIRTTAELFLHLKEDPFGALATHLRSSRPESWPPGLQARIAADIEILVSLLSQPQSN